MPEPMHASESDDFGIIGVSGCLLAGSCFVLGGTPEMTMEVDPGGLPIGIVLLTFDHEHEDGSVTRFTFPLSKDLVAKLVEQMPIELAEGQRMALAYSVKQRRN